MIYLVIQTGGKTYARKFETNYQSDCDELIEFIEAWVLEGTAVTIVDEDILEEMFGDDVEIVEPE